MAQANSWGRSVINRGASRLALVSGSLLVASITAACGGIGAIHYQAREADRSARSRSDVALLDVDCREPVGSLADCTYNGAPLSWKVLGSFETPAKARSRWPRYRSDVQAAAARHGCPAVAIRRAPPPRAGDVGAFCVDPGTQEGALPPVGSATLVPVPVPVPVPTPVEVMAPPAHPAPPSAIVPSAGPNNNNGSR